MNYTDEQLKQALAKMLPRTVCYGSPQGSDGLHWRPLWHVGSYRSVSDAELLHLCWLAEETLISDEWAQFENTVYWHSISTIYIHATWQERVTALAKVKGIEI